MPLPSGLAPWTEHVVDRTLSGSIRVKVRPPQGGRARDVTYFRDIPTQISSYAFGDPFGPSTASITFPQITILDALGYGDLDWLVSGADVDIDWMDALTGEITRLWEGYIVSLSYSGSEDTSQVSVQCKGALYQVDNYESYPTYPYRPYPYEIMIRQGIDPHRHPGLRTKPMRMVFPDDWSLVVKKPGDDDPSYMKPFKLKVGQKWTGMTSRTTGSWNKMLTGQIQSLLQLMYTSDGSQWTLMLNHGRNPVLRVRQIKYEADEDTLYVHCAQPGVKVDLSEDWTQAANVYYGQGTDVAGSQFSNAVVSLDGKRTSYIPFAALRQVYPATHQNLWYDPSVMRIETHVQFDNYLTTRQATQLALSQLQRSAHPGFTGSVTLSVDPEVQIVDPGSGNTGRTPGQTFSRFQIQPGMTLYLGGFRGRQDGLLVHIAEVSVSVDDGSVALTVDSKFRDLLTISQVRARTRDALSTLRALRPGSFSPVVHDLRLPWSYAHGAGMIPTKAKKLFNDYARKGDDRFPWTSLTTRFPPKKYPHFYIHIPPSGANLDFNFNWAGQRHPQAAGSVNNSDVPEDMWAVPVLFAESGEIRLTQVAAYDRHGQVMPIRFHLAFYKNENINITSMPKIPLEEEQGYLPRFHDHIGQYYPFFPGAFESVDPNGAPKAPNSNTMADPSIVVAWGNYYQGAGYYPGLQSEGGKPTGMLVDETTWSFDTTESLTFIQRPDQDTPQNKNAGRLYLMIYAESNPPPEPVYFLGRCFRSNPGSST